MAKCAKSKAIAKSRNPFQVQARFRKAGAHGRSKKAERADEKRKLKRQCSEY